MQHGSLIKSVRKYGPDVWQFRWSEKGPQNRRIYRKRVIGTVEDYGDMDCARRAVAGLLSEINSDARRIGYHSMTFAQLCNHFEQRELAKDNTWRSYSTKKTYGVYLKRWVSTRLALFGVLRSDGPGRSDSGQRTHIDRHD